MTNVQLASDTLILTLVRFVEKVLAGEFVSERQEEGRKIEWLKVLCRQLRLECVTYTFSVARGGGAATGSLFVRRTSLLKPRSFVS